MQKRGFIVINGYKLIPSIEYCANRLVEEFSNAGVKVDVIKSTKLEVYLNKDKIESTIKDYSFCVFLDKDYYLSHMLEQLGIRVFNSAKAIELCDDKMKTYLALANKGIKMPKTVSGPLNYSGQNNPEFIETITKILDFPIVIKENFGSQGSKVYMANNIEDLKIKEAEITANARLYQETIKESWGEDYRLIVIGNRFVAGMRRHSENGDFRSNINLGGAGDIVNMPSEYIQTAESVSKILGLDYCGVDILKSSEGPILCEVNSNAFFKKIEEVTKINVAALYVKHILASIN